MADGGRQPIIFVIFFNRKDWTEGLSGAGVPSAPLDPPVQWSEVLYIPGFPSAPEVGQVLTPFLFRIKPTKYLKLNKS